MFFEDPKVTILMPVYNGEKYIREAIESILSQTFTDFEFLIIDDGSTDQSAVVISSYNDPRIRLVNNERNLGLVHTLNRGLELARGELIARMDSDDISLPDRIRKQVELMNGQPEVGVCGCWIEWLDREVIMDYPVNDPEIKRNLTFTCPLAHPTVMMRADLVKRYNVRYDPEYQHAEDYELWSRLSLITNFANIPEVLLRYRIHENQICQRHHSEQMASIAKVKAKMSW
jgi:glycosyltransferase involved in cell wall biosynthesis